MVGDLVESELASMDKAIEEAAGRIEVSKVCCVLFCSRAPNLVHYAVINSCFTRVGN
jgi:hypothetical protein